MLHAPNDARGCLRLQLGLRLGQPHHLHQGAEKVSGKKHDICHNAQCYQINTKHTTTTRSSPPSLPLAS